MGWIVARYYLIKSIRPDSWLGRAIIAAVRCFVVVAVGILRLRHVTWLSIGWLLVLSAAYAAALSFHR